MTRSAISLIDSLGSLAQKGPLAQEPSDFQARMARAGHWLTLSRGQPLYLAGDLATSVFGLESGGLDIAIPIETGEEVVIHQMKPGEWTGEAALMPDVTRPLSVWSAAESRLFCVPAEAIRRNVAETLPSILGTFTFFSSSVTAIPSSWHDSRPSCFHFRPRRVLPACCSVWPHPAEQRKSRKRNSVARPA